jgi:hypothetical protein
MLAPNQHSNQTRHHGAPRANHTTSRQSIHIDAHNRHAAQPEEAQSNRLPVPAHPPSRLKAQARPGLRRATRG